jgi:uncharacterized membrane protein YhaH (DUF805 family)
MNWYVEVLKKYAVFDGRARRQEYWMFYLFNLLISVGIGIVLGVLTAVSRTNMVGISYLYSLAILVPSIAVSVRRLHDTGKSGWWLLLVVVPFGAFVVLYFLIQVGVAGPNQYGPDPKTGDAGYVPSPAVTATAPAGWLADPTGRHELRYWDASVWTQHVSDNGVVSVDPL